MKMMMMGRQDGQGRVGVASKRIDIPTDFLLQLPLFDFVL